MDNVEEIWKYNLAKFVFVSFIKFARGDTRCSARTLTVTKSCKRCNLTCWCFGQDDTGYLLGLALLLMNTYFNHRGYFMPSVYFLRLSGCTSHTLFFFFKWSQHQSGHHCGEDLKGPLKPELTILNAELALVGKLMMQKCVNISCWCHIVEISL